MLLLYYCQYIRALSLWTLGDVLWLDPRTNPSDQPMQKSPPIMGEERHLIGVYYSYTLTEGTQASRDVKSD